MLQRVFRRHGFWTTKSARANVAIVRVEDLSKALPAIGDWISAPALVLSNGNLGADKWYSDRYKAFIKAFRPTEAELEAYYGSRIARHFYSSGEIAAQIMAWN